MRFAPFFALALFAACGAEQGSSSSSLTRAPGACGQIETHVIGVYESSGDASVVIERAGKHALVLSGHAAMTWHVSVASGAELEHVYAVGYHHQAVDAPAGVDVLTESHDDGTADANGFAYPDDNTRHLLELAAIRVHHEPTSFHGCHTAATWTIGADMAVTSDCDGTVYKQYDAVLDCNPNGGDGSCGSGSGSGGGIF